MKLLQISKNQLRITLSRQDLNEFDLTVRTMDYNTTETRKAIWEIFDRAKAQTGFDAAKSKISIKVFPLSDGGCDMYVSKLRASELSRCEFSPPPRAIRKKFRYISNTYAYRFASFADLQNACSAIPTCAESSLYLDSKNNYILLLKKSKKSITAIERWTEHSERISCSYMTAYLNERCKLICGNDAIAKLKGKN